MAVSTTNAYTGPLAANGATTTFPFTFSVLSGADLTVVLRDADGVETTVSAGDYSVTLSGSAPSAGSVVFDTAPASGNDVWIYLDPDFTQETDFSDGHPFIAGAVNNINDRAALRDQVLKRDVGRALLLPIGETTPELAAAADRMGKFLAFDAAGDPTMSEGLGSDADLRTDLAGSGGAALSGFIQSGTGAVAETVQATLRRVVWVEQFGAVGDGSTDDTTALTKFFNHAIANPGIPHFMGAKTYCVTAALPTINVSNVWIEGAHAEIHDVGTLMTGTVIKWTGATAAGTSVVTIQPNTGASAQRLANIKFKGIGIDCNSGAVGIGLTMKSVQESEIEIAVANASDRGVELNVVATLGEARDLQRNFIILNLRQIEAPAGLGVVLGGDATANVSLNHFWVDAQHKDTTAIYVVNADNNDWHYVRTFRAGGGSATEAMSLLGGASLSVAARAERIHFYTGTVGVHAYGTGSYTAASISNAIYRLDTENATPAPTIDAGASIHWAKDTSELANDAWIDYTPTIAATSGTITTASGSGRYLRRGNIIFLRLNITITTNGTGAGALTATLPVNSVGSLGSMMNGKERAVTGKQVSGFIDGGGASTVALQFYDGTYPGADGHVITAYGAYEIAQ